MVRILMLSKWHVHAEDYARDVANHPDAEITCVWDEDAQRGAKWAAELSVPFEADLEKAVAREDVDAVIVDSPTTDHRRVIVAAANAGKHIFTEKALAATLEDCKAISEAVKKSGVKFCISHPHLTTSVAQYAKQAIDEGWLGKIHYMRMRMAHAGSLHGWLPQYWYDCDKAGGGAMMDLGCHPVYTALHLLGTPVRVASVFNTTVAPAPADDNAVSVVEFEGGAIAVLETAFVSPYHTDHFELLGTEGAIIHTGKNPGELKVRSNKFGEGWFRPDRLPAPLPSSMRMWLAAIQKNTDIPFDMAKAIALTDLLEKAYDSHKEQRIVPING